MQHILQQLHRPFKSSTTSIDVLKYDGSPPIFQVCFLNDERGKWEGQDDVRRSEAYRAPAELFCLSFSELLITLQQQHLASGQHQYPGVPNACMAILLCDL